MGTAFQIVDDILDETATPQELGKATRIDRLEVRWPNGQNEVIEGAAVNQMLTVTEGKGITGRTTFVRR